MVFRPLGDLNSRWNKKFKKMPVGGAISEKFTLKNFFSNFVDGKNLTLFSSLK